MGVTFVLAGIYLLALSSFTPDSKSGSLGLTLAVVGVLLAILVGATQRYPEASQLSITPNAVSIRLSHGGQWSLLWSDPEFGLTLRDFSEEPSARSALKAHITLLLPKGRITPVPASVLEALVSAAHRQNLPVVVREEMWVAGRRAYRAEVTRIGVAEHTPGWAHARPVQD